jgi:hypothetical protein
MAHFDYPPGTPLGTVAANYILPSTDWSYNIAQVYKSINGDEGGTWAPSAFITVGGSGFEFTGTGHSLAASARLTVQSTGELRVANGGLIKLDGNIGDIRLEVSSNVATLTSQAASVVNLDGTTSIQGDVTWDSGGPGTCTFENGCSLSFQSGSTVTCQSGSTVTFQSGATLTGNNSSTGTWNGTWTCGSTLAVTGVATFSSTVNCNSALVCATTIAVTGAATLSSTLTVAGALTANGAATFNALFKRSGTAAYEELRTGAGPDSSSAIDVTDYDVWTAPITANRTWTLNDGPAGKSVKATFVAPAANTLSLSAPASGLAVDVSRTALSGDYRVVELIWCKTEWLVLSGTTV